MQYSPSRAAWLACLGRATGLCRLNKPDTRQQKDTRYKKNLRGDVKQTDTGDEIYKSWDQRENEKKIKKEVWKTETNGSRQKKAGYSRQESRDIWPETRQAKDFRLEETRHKMRHVRQRNMWQVSAERRWNWKVVIKSGERRWDMGR